MQDRATVKDHVLAFINWLESNNLCLGGHQEDGQPREWLLSRSEQSVAVERFLIETFEGKPKPTEAEKRFYAAYNFLDDHTRNRDAYIQAYMEKYKSRHMEAMESWSVGYSNLCRHKSEAWKAVSKERLERDRIIAKKIGIVI